MSRGGIFGWSLPPGCGRLPGEEPDPPCAVCGLDPGLCVCPECPTCGEQGNPACYAEDDLNRGHGLELTEKQIAAKANAEADAAGQFDYVEPDFGDIPDGSFYDDQATE